jgi:hypothetical protein
MVDVQAWESLQIIAVPEFVETYRTPMLFSQTQIVIALQFPRRQCGNI